jgi:hypothetical protein
MVKESETLIGLVETLGHASWLEGSGGELGSGIGIGGELGAVNGRTVRFQVAMVSDDILPGTRGMSGVGLFTTDASRA